ncbi:hypothetical protein [Chitinimonas sp.]|uniref:hypothetical protein n=1 Tax=Chitinimonas sp. TaxID=1934313 RepID=UPI0035AF11AC
MAVPNSPDLFLSPQGAWGAAGAALVGAVWMGYAVWQRVGGDARATELQSKVDRENADLIKRLQDEIAGLVDQRDKAFTRADQFAAERNDAIAEVGSLRTEVASLRKELEEWREENREQREHVDSLLLLINHLLFDTQLSDATPEQRLALLHGFGPAKAKATVDSLRTAVAQAAK